MIILILKRIYQFGLETRFIVITPWAPKVTWFPKAVRLGFSYCTEYCREFGLEELEPNPINLINFLYYQFKEKNRQYSTINSYRSAVSSTLRNYPECKVPIGQTPIVCRFMRGVHRLKPPKKEVISSLTYLRGVGAGETLPLRFLLLKTAFLVALVCIKRPADVCNMCIVEGYWQLSADGFCRQPLGYGKTEMHNPVPPMKIDPLTSDQLLCPVKHLIVLEKRLKSIRGVDERRFWISAKKPYKAVTSRTMCTWLKKLLSSLELPVLPKMQDPQLHLQLFNRILIWVKFLKQQTGKGHRRLQGFISNRRS